MKNFLLSLILISNSAFANVCELPEKVALGDKAPCAGYLFSDANELKIRTDLVYKQSLIDNLTKQNSLQTDMLKLDADEIKQYQGIHPLTEWEKVLYFGFGVLVAGVASYGAMRIVRP